MLGLLTGQHKDPSDSASNAQHLKEISIKQYLQTLSNNMVSQNSFQSLQAEYDAVQFAARLRSLDALDLDMLTDVQILKLHTKLQKSYLDCQTCLGHQERHRFEKFNEYCQSRLGLAQS